MQDMKSKMDVLKKLKDAASAKMKGGLKGMMGMGEGPKGMGAIKKVSVMADSPKALKAGLETAEEVVEDAEDAYPQPKAEGEEGSKVDSIMKAAEDLSAEECDELILKLTEKKEASKEESSEEESEEESNPFADM